MSKEENSELVALKRKKKRVENAINSQSKRLKLAKDNGSDMSNIKRTLNNSKEALVRIQGEIDTCEGKKPKKAKPQYEAKVPTPPKGRDIKDSFPTKAIIILGVAIAVILVLALNGVI